MLAAFQRTAKRLRLNIVDIRDFVLGSDPRRRGQNNVALLTSRADYDVVFVADASGEFAREVPYQVQDPRPVVGAAGLVAQAWHWAWERHGAPQLNKRFSRRAKRPMTGYDWAAWLSVKVLAEAVLRTGGAQPAALHAHITGPALIMDGFKGNRMNFRSWNQQLRQPVLLTHANWIVARAPLDGFLHRLNHLDLLGLDAPESACRWVGKNQ
jgi:ABC transporter substrate binding protein (PQQ-dependent alcohol dehydrogenase system)